MVGAPLRAASVHVHIRHILGSGTDWSDDGAGGNSAADSATPGHS